MRDWTQLDRQMGSFGPYLRDGPKIIPPESDALASVLAEEVRSLPRNTLTPVLSGPTLQLKDRLDELLAFQSFMDFVRASPENPGLVRAQVIAQNYLSFVYLGDACFKALKGCAAPGSVTRRCCKFLTENPVRAFRNAVAHANWTYRSDYSGLVFWARKGSDPNEPLRQFEVSQNDLGFWQALARCTAYVAYTELSVK
jgi:hypothetical protein